MGYFSWLKADSLTEVVNIASGLPFKCLIPKEFDNTRKGYIEDIYRDYGFLSAPTKEQLEDPNISDWNRRGRYDLFELLAVWNREYILDTDVMIGASRYPAGTKVGDILSGVPDNVFMKEIDVCTDFNHEIGLAIGSSDRDIDKLKYPLKLVSPNYKRTYEQCAGISYNDPAQGCRNLRQTFYNGVSGSKSRYDGVYWHDVYVVWQKIEEMRYDNCKVQPVISEPF